MLCPRSLGKVGPASSGGRASGLDNPERHAIRDLKRDAEALITDALRRARGLAYTAEAIRQLHIQKEGDPS